MPRPKPNPDFPAMPRYVALLRGINLGRRRLKMDLLAGLFETLGFSRVSTFIASGNVLFETKSKDESALSKRIENHLEKSLGYEVDTFLRTAEEIQRTAAFEPFEKSSGEGDRIHVIFCREALPESIAAKLGGIKTDVDEFCVEGREVYWLCRVRIPDSKVWSLPELKALKLPTTTMRNRTSVQKLAALFERWDS
jgi:uncharacterized protein (DUF1697 family)